MKNKRLTKCSAFCKSQTYLGQISKKSKAYFRHTLSISQTYLIQILGISQM